MEYIFNEELYSYATQKVISSEPLGGKTWAGLKPTVTSGNLYGHGFPGEKEERTDPREQIIVSYLLRKKSGGFFYPTWLGVDPAVPGVKFRWQDTEEFGELWGPVAALLYDADGDSYTLGDPNKSYAFKSAVYVGDGTGTIKVTHATDPVKSKSGQQWWTEQYGRKPDPALNLPNRFLVNEDDEFALNEDHSRMEMRGFIMREGEADPKTGEYALLGGPPKDGDLVRLCARVYNFALNNATGEFDVLFEIVPIDKIGEEAGPRETIGTVRTELDPLLPVIDQVPMVEACVPWDTTGFFSPDYTYRFYATADPENEVDSLLVDVLPKPTSPQSWRDELLELLK